MNNRQNDILKALYKESEFLTFEQLARRTSVSVKTVRNDVAEIKGYLAQNNLGRLETKPHIGIKAIISEEQWKKLLANEDDANEREIIFFIIIND